MKSKLEVNGFFTIGMAMENGLTRFIYEKSPIFFQNMFVSAVGRQNKKRRYGRKFHDQLEFLQKSQWFSKEELEEYQNSMLRRLIKHAYERSPYYGDLMKEHKLAPEDIKNKQDLTKLPILSKEFVKANHQSLFCTGFPKNQLLHGHTSGTTGTALPLVYTRDALASEYATVWRLLTRFGVSLGSNYATFAGRMVVPLSQKSPPFWRYNYAGRQKLFSLYHMSRKNLKHYVEELERCSFEYYNGYPSSIFLVASYIVESGIDFGNPPKAIFTSAETLFDYQKRAIEDAFKAHVYDRYGNSEFCSSMIQCQYGNYHVDMEFGIVEIDPLEETDDYVRGKLLCTGFANFAMPLIRYEIGDVATVSKHLCPCGRKSTMVEQIDGRIEDYVITPDGNRIGRMDHVFKDMLNIKESQIIQESPESITVKVVKRRDYGVKDEEALMREFRQRLGDEIGIDLDYVEEIPRGANGKFRAVISDIKESKVGAERHAV